MITEDYVSFETAKLLKEKGFNYKCTHCFALGTSEIQNIYDDVTSGYSPLEPCDWNHITEEELCQMGLSEWTNLSAPTFWAATKWLREAHGLHIRPDCIGKDNWAILIQSFDGKDYPVKEITIGLFKRIQESNYPSYETAINAAIKYCLLNLI